MKIKESTPITVLEAWAVEELGGGGRGTYLPRSYSRLNVDHACQGYLLDVNPRVLMTEVWPIVSVEIRRAAYAQARAYWRGDIGRIDDAAFWASHASAAQLAVLLAAIQVVITRMIERTHILGNYSN